MEIDSPTRRLAVPRIARGFGRIRPTIRRIGLANTLLLTLAATAIRAEDAGGDWPQFLGPSRDGTYTGTDLVREWPEGDPKVLWRIPIGSGFSGPVVGGSSDGKLRVVLFQRLKDEEVISCLDARDGSTLWEHRYATTYRDRFGFDEGPRGTPSIAEDRVFTFGAEGVLTCVSFADGKPLWKVETHRRFEVPESFFGAACSPLVEGDLVIVQVGGAEGGGIVAFDREKGEVRWKATSHDAGYASPIAATIGEKRLVIALTREGLTGIEAATGKLVFEERFRARLHASVNAATPLVAGDRIFVTASYSTGAALFTLRDGALSSIWKNDASLSCHYATPVLYDDLLFGFHGRQEAGPALRCVRLSTGRVLWSEERFGAGSIIRARDRLWILREDGELILADASEDGHRRLGSSRILRGTARAYPALGRGRLFARDETELVAIDLRR